MQLGGWIPIDKNFINSLPKDRAYSELEAIFSITYNYDQKKHVTVSGYAKCWKWSRKKVCNFLKKVGIEVIYPKNTRTLRNQRGHIRIHKRDIKGTYKEHIRVIDNSKFDEYGNIKGTYKEHIRNIKGSTTKETKKLKLKLKTKTKKKTYLETSDEFRVAEFLYHNILKHKPDYKQPNLQKWAAEADFMLRIDKRSLDTAKKMIVWVQSDVRERIYTMSTTSLRKNFDMLEIKMNTKKPSGQTAKMPKRSIREILEATLNEDGKINEEEIRT